jgi:hypothetical protein
VGCVALLVLVFAALPGALRCAVVCLVQGVATGLTRPKTAAQRASFVGYTAIVLNIASYSSPLGVMGTVIKVLS